MIQLGPRRSIDHIMVKHPFQTAFCRQSFIPVRSVLLTAAIVKPHPMLTDGHFTVILFQHFVKIFYVIVIHIIIRINTGDVFSSSPFNSVISRI